MKDWIVACMSAGWHVLASYCGAADVEPPFEAIFGFLGEDGLDQTEGCHE